MKLIYIANTRLPSEKANSYQTMQMCYSFSKVFDEVELWTGKARNTKELDKVKDVFKYYNIEKTFFIRKFFQFDSKILFNLNEFIWANLRYLIFSVNVCLSLVKYKKSSETIIYTRVWHILYVFLFLKKIGFIDNKIFFESHKFSKFLLKPLSKIDGLVVINNYLGSLYKEQNIKNFFVAHDGVNINEYECISNYKFTSNKEEYTVVYTGSLFSWKGVNTLVDSLKYLPENIKLVCIGGSGKYLTDFKGYVQNNSGFERITIIPHVPKIELMSYIEQADVLVLPNSAKDKMSLYTSPIKMFEYMASNRPIVASSLSSIKEVLSHRKDAMLFDPDNAKDLANKINAVINQDCKKMVDSAFVNAKQYTWDKRAENIAEFINTG